MNDMPLSILERGLLAFLQEDQKNEIRSDLEIAIILQTTEPIVHETRKRLILRGITAKKMPSQVNKREHKKKTNESMLSQKKDNIPTQKQQDLYERLCKDLDIEPQDLTGYQIQKEIGRLLDLSKKKRSTDQSQTQKKEPKKQESESNKQELLKVWQGLQNEPTDRN